MADQNILAGDINVLAQVRSDVKEYEGNCDRLYALNQSVSSLSKNIDVMCKNVKDEVDATVKKRRDDVAAGFNNAIDIDKEKVKQVQAEREKAKSKGIKERIAMETEDLARDNEEMNSQILEAFRVERIPRMCRNRLYLALFVTKGIKDILICIAVFAVFYCAVPLIINLIFPELSKLVMSGIYLLIICLGFFIYKCINDILFVPHAETMLGVRTTRKKIDANKRMIKKIRRSIKKDTNEEMYGLESFDDKLGELYSDVERIEGERAIALEEFDNSTRPDIVDEIESRDRDRIQAMKTELEEKAASLSKLQDRVKQQKIYISSNYEAYIGSEFVSSAKLDSLYEIMRSTNVKTIGQALMVYDERK